MFLKNVRPVVAKHTEWRSFDTQPTCFTDSECDIHNSGSSVSGKVQMIIESLKSSQSSVDMNSDCEALGRAGLFAHRERSRPETEYIRAKDQNSDCMKRELQSQGSESDDSVDREIEEAIQEFLKKKGNKKEKPVQRRVTNQLSRDHQKSNPNKNSNNNKIHTAINKPCTGKPTQSLLGKKDADIPLLFVSDIGTATVLKHHSSFETTKDPKNLTAKHQTNDFSDSSSDDGIEEEIQRYLLEKQNEKFKKYKSQQSQKQSNSRSDSIEKTMHQCKTDKQKNKKSAKAPNPPKSKHTRVNITQKYVSDHHPISETTNKIIGGLITDNSQAVICKSSGTGLSSCDFKGNSHSLTHSEFPAQSSSSLKVSTTAKLMCTEAILDISNVTNTVSFTAISIPTSPVFSEHPTEDCDSHSGKSLVDNENTAQETTEFLELKEQVQKLSPEKTNAKTLTNKDGDNTELLQEKKKKVSQNKKVRLSLSWKRKLKEDLKIFKGSQLESLAFCEQNSNSLSSTSDMSAETCTDLHVTLTENIEPVKTIKDSKSCQNRENAQRCKSNEEPEILIKPILKSKEFKATRCSKRTLKKASSDKNSSLDSDDVLDLPMKNLVETRKMVQTNTSDKDKSKSVSFGAVQLIVPISEKTTLVEPKTRPIQVAIKNYISKSDVTMKNSLINNKNLNGTLNNGTAKQLTSVEMAKPSSQIKLSVKQRAQTGVAKLSHGANQCVIPKGEEISSPHTYGSNKQMNRKFLAKKVKVSEVEAGKVDKRYKITASGSVRARETKMKCQQTEVQATTEVPILGCVKAAVLQGTPSAVPVPISNASLSSPQLRGAEVKERKNTMCSEKLTPLVTGKKIKKRKLVDHINLGNHNTNVVPTAEEVLSQSQGPVMLNENSAASTRVGEVGQAYISEQPSIIHCHLAGSHVPAEHVSCTKFPTAEVNVCHSNVVNTDQRSAEPHTGARLPCPTHPPSPKMRKGSQGLLQDFSLAENRVHIQKDKSVNVEVSAYKNNHIQIRNMDQHLAGSTRDHKGKGQEIKVEEEDLFTVEDAEYVDETDYDSDGRGGSSQSSQERKRPRTLFLSTSIDPGVKIRPYIILETPQRYQKYMKSRKHMFTEHQKTSEMIPALHQNTKSEKRKNCSNMSVNVKTFYAKTPTTKKITKDKPIKRKLQLVTALTKL